MTQAMFPHLMAPLDLGRTVLRNRLYMGSMHTRIDMQDQPARRMAAFYGERAKGGVAVIVTGGCSPNEEGLIEPGAPMLVNEEQLHEHKPVTDEVHEHGGKILLQLLHAGRNGKIDALVDRRSTRACRERCRPKRSNARWKTSCAARGWPSRAATTAWKSWARRVT